MLAGQQDTPVAPRRRGPASAIPVGIPGGTKPPNAYHMMMKNQDLIKKIAGSELQALKLAIMLRSACLQRQRVSCNRRPCCENSAQSAQSAAQASPASA